jgi:hypothetical protein
MGETMNDQGNIQHRKRVPRPVVEFYATQVQRFKANPLTQLVYRHPRMVLSSVWLMFMLVGMVAGMSLMSLGPDRQAKLAQEVQRVHFHRDRSSNPVWSLGTIALGCALGSLMISQRIKQSRTPRRLVKRSPAFPNS